MAMNDIEFRKAFVEKYKNLSIAERAEFLHGVLPLNDGPLNINPCSEQPLPSPSRLETIDKIANILGKTIPSDAPPTDRIPIGQIPGMLAGNAFPKVAKQDEYDHNPYPGINATVDVDLTEDRKKEFDKFLKSISVENIIKERTAEIAGKTLVGDNIDVPIIGPNADSVTRQNYQIVHHPNPLKRKRRPSA